MIAFIVNVVGCWADRGLLLLLELTLSKSNYLNIKENYKLLSVDFEKVIEDCK